MEGFLKTLPSIVQALSIAVIDHVGEPDGTEENKEFYKGLRWDIWGTGNEKDKLKPRIDAALQKLADICQRHLK